MNYRECYVFEKLTASRLHVRPPPMADPKTAAAVFVLIYFVRWTVYVYKRPELLQRQSARLQLGESNLNVSAMAQMSSAFCTLSPA